jgi:hypothetical protein
MLDKKEAPGVPPEEKSEKPGKPVILEFRMYRDGR